MYKAEGLVADEMSLDQDEVIEVDVATLVRPKNSGSIHCTAGSLMRDPEPKSY